MSIRLYRCVWPASDLAQRVAANDAVICTASLLASGDSLESTLELLSSAERVRFAGYSNEIVARRFASGRRIVREMLASVLGMPAAAVPLREGLHGKPHLAAGATHPLWFSLSHCDELLVVAMSRVSDIGVDVEHLRAFEQWQRIADRVLDPQERRQLDIAIGRGEDPSTAFLKHWCRVEAELKAIGCGIVGLEAHRAGSRPSALRLADLTQLPLPFEIASLGGRYQAAVALCAPAAAMLRHARAATPHEAMPTMSPESASTA